MTNNFNSLASADLIKTMRISMKYWRRFMTQAIQWEGLIPDDFNLARLPHIFSADNPLIEKADKQMLDYQTARDILEQRGDLPSYEC